MVNLTPETWNEVSPYLDTVLALTEGSRASWIESLAREKPVLANILKEVLEEYRSLADDHFLERAPGELNHASMTAGQCVGSYTLIAPIGQGGMGTVWLARRSDGRFERKVAVKFLSFLLGSKKSIERFKREGKIAGQLAHPHIAELIDAGVDRESRPYLIFEYVDGMPIDRYCDERKLSVRQRLELFLDVLDAVGFAHSSLIVHRDLKPANVYVSKSGQVKLLDFGIAKLLSESVNPSEATQATLDGGSALTPLFAAPEQVSGGLITTAADEYALGLLLYLLVTGRHPAGPGPYSAADLIKAIIDKVPPRASDSVTDEADLVEQRSSTPEKLRKQLRGDLDTIIATTLKKDPAERYSSVAALADDLSRYLKHEPIGARPDSALYTVGKFVRRNRAAVLLSMTAILVVVASLTTGLIVAERQRAIAERRFSQVKELANKHIALDIYLRLLPGATTIRKQVVTDSLQYLSSLGNERNMSNDLALDIAVAYIRVAHVQGDPTQSNLGQYREALASLAQAEKFGDAVLAKEHDNHRALGNKAEVFHDRMQIYEVQGRNEEELKAASQAWDATERWDGGKRFQPKDVYMYAWLLTNISEAFNHRRHFPEALQVARAADEATKRAAGAEDIKDDVELDYADALFQLGDLTGAMDHAKKADQLTMLAADRDQIPIRMNYCALLDLEATILGGKDGMPSFGSSKDASRLLQKATKIADDVATEDQADYLGRQGLAGVALHEGNILRHSNPIEALHAYDHALNRIHEVTSNEAMQFAESELLSASSYPARWQGASRDAEKRIQRSFQILEDLHRFPTDKVEPMGPEYHALQAQADYFAATGKPDQAIAAYRELLDKLMAWNLALKTDLRDAVCISRTWTQLASLLRKANHPADAAALETRRTALWNDWKGKLPNLQLAIRQSMELMDNPQ